MKRHYWIILGAAAIVLAFMLYRKSQEAKRTEVSSPASPPVGVGAAPKIGLAID